MLPLPCIALPPHQPPPLRQACGRLPELLRLAGGGVRCGAADLGMMGAAAAEALRRSEVRQGGGGLAFNIPSEEAGM